MLLNTDKNCTYLSYDSVSVHEQRVGINSMYYAILRTRMYVLTQFSIRFVESKKCVFYNYSFIKGSATNAKIEMMEQSQQQWC